MYFEDIDRSIDIYTGKDSLTKEPVEYVKPLYDNSDDYFHKGNGEYEITHVAPIYAETKYPEKKIVVKDEIELCRAIKSVTEREGKQFIYSYISDPDSTMHREGVRSEKAKAKIESINREVENLSKSLSNTLIIVTADHGGHDRTHGTEMSEDMTIPMFFIGERFEGGKEIENVGLLDIAPTVTDIMGVSPAPEWEGRSLAK
jgi:phosphopentomutase